MNKQSMTIAAACAMALSARSGALAQTTNVTTMEKTVIEGIPLEETVVPTARPFNSVYGTDRSILDTPRSVTIISREQLDAISIHDVREFSKLTSSSYTRSNFGAPTTPDIRTQIADTFVNGSRVGLTSNGNGLPVNFNSVESVNIVKGPASVVYGPSQYVGGYIDYITKRPFFDAFHGDVFGEFGMYSQYRWGLDFGAPIGEEKKSAYRVSYSGESSGSYYLDGFKKTEAVYGAYNWVPNDTYELFFNNEIFWANYTENFGINRPTQSLIDSGLYQTGVNANPAPAAGYPPYFDASGKPLGFGVGPGGSTAVGVVGGTPAPSSDPQNSRWVVSGFPYVNHIALGPVVQISRRSRLLMPGDASNGTSYNAQTIQTVKLADDAQLVDTTFFRYVRRNTLSSYSYSEIIDPSWSLDNRTEYRLNLEHHAINTGVDLRYQSVRAYNDFFNEPANVWDLTRSHYAINYFKSVNSPSPFTQVAVPGSSWPNRYYTPNNGDSGTSSALFFGPFVQEDWKITDKLSVLAGGRVDLLSADYHVDWTDPSGKNSLRDSTVVGLPNANASVNYKWIPELSSYATYNYSQNPVGATGNGGGITTGGNSSFSNASLRNNAILYEVGSKASLYGNKLFLNLALFEQERGDRQQDLSVVEFRTKGVEFEVNYQPSRNLYVTVGYSYFIAEVNAPQFFVNNTDLPYYSNPGITAGPGPYRRQGTPSNLVNLLTTYKFDNGLGVSANLVATSEINNNVSGTIKIPAQFTVDLSVFYAYKRFEARVSALNVTDEKNWSAPNAVYGNESVVADLPFRLEGRVTVKF
jgi:catecholate siderophore receptor